jgi:hypothetical protein
MQPRNLAAAGVDECELDDGVVELLLVLHAAVSIARTLSAATV